MLLVIATWILNQSDKLIIAKYFSKTDLGIYSFGFTLGIDSSIK